MFIVLRGTTFIYNNTTWKVLGPELTVCAEYEMEENSSISFDFKSILCRTSFRINIDNVNNWKGHWGSPGGLYKKRGMFSSPPENINTLPSPPPTTPPKLLSSFAFCWPWSKRHWSVHRRYFTTRYSFLLSQSNLNILQNKKNLHCQPSSSCSIGG